MLIGNTIKLFMYVFINNWQSHDNYSLQSEIKAWRTHNFRSYGQIVTGNLALLSIVCTRVVNPRSIPRPLYVGMTVLIK